MSELNISIKPLWSRKNGIHFQVKHSKCLFQSYQNKQKKIRVIFMSVFVPPTNIRLQHKFNIPEYNSCTDIWPDPSPRWANKHKTAACSRTVSRLGSILKPSPWKHHDHYPHHHYPHYLAQVCFSIEEAQTKLRLEAYVYFPGSVPLKKKWVYQESISRTE